MSSWAWNWKKGYSYTSPPIVSGSDVKKQPFSQGNPKLNVGSGITRAEKWGSYKKTYSKSMFGQMLFTPPKSVDGIPILCPCRGIDGYMRAGGEGQIILGAGAALLFGKNRPACWDDAETITNPGGVRHFI